MRMSAAKKGNIMHTMRDWIKLLQLLDFMTEKISFYCGIIFMSLSSAAFLAAPTLVRVADITTENTSLVGISTNYFNILEVVGLVTFGLSVAISIIRVVLSFQDSTSRMDSLKSLFNDLLLALAVVSVTLIAAPIAFATAGR